MSTWGLVGGNNMKMEGIMAEMETNKRKNCFYAFFNLNIYIFLQQV